MLNVDEQEIRFRKLFTKLHISEQVLSTVLGGLVVVVIAFFVVNYFKEVKRSEQITAEAASTVNEALLAKEQELDDIVQDQVYVIQTGDDLSEIAEKFYGDKEKWTVIVEANDLFSPDYVMVGQELIIPGVSVKSPEVAGESSGAGTVLGSDNVERFTEGTYVVQLGDSLETVSLKAYGTREHWPELMQANGLISPDHLEVGQELVIPR